MKCVKNILILFLVLLLSCSEKTEGVSIPKDIIQKEAMAELLADVQYIEAADAKKIIGIKSREEVYLYYKETFDQHETTQEQFEKSLSFYESHPLILQEIYEDVITILSERKAQIQLRP